MNMKYKFLFRRRVLLPALAVLVAGGVVVTKAKPRKEVIVVERETVDAVFGIGTLQPRESFQLKLALAATVLRLFKSEGDSVSKGEPLVEVQGLGIFRAPIAGVLTSLPFHEGENVPAQSALLTVTRLDSLYVLVQLEQTAIARVTKGQKARLQFEAFGDQVLFGKVVSAYSNEGKFWAKIEPSSLPVQALPGMTSDVAIEVSEKRKGNFIPALAAKGKKELLVEREGAKRRAVQVSYGAADADHIEILSKEIVPGDKIVVP